MWSLSLCGISFKTMSSFPVVEFPFTPHSTEQRLVRTGQLSFVFARRKKKDSALFIVFVNAAVMCIVCKSPLVPWLTVQMRTQFSNITEINSLIRAFLCFRLLNTMMNILFIFLPAAKFCLYQKRFLLKGTLQHKLPGWMNSRPWSYLTSRDGEQTKDGLWKVSNYWE